MEWTTLQPDTSFVSPPAENKQEVLSGFIDSVTYGYLTIVLRVILNPVLAVCAFWAGIINIGTFVKMDLNQGVNLNLLILSISDFFMSMVTVSGNCCYVLLWMEIYGVGSVSVVDAVYFSLRLITFPLNISLVITTIIAVVRCLSVVMPFSFRDIATARRQLIAIGVGSLISLSIPSYILVNFYRVVTGASRSEKLRYMAQNCIVAINCTMFNISRYIFFFTCLSIIIACMIFLIIALKKSSKFQAHSTKPTAKDNASKPQPSKETQVMKTVIMILAVYVAGNIPLMVLTMIRLVLPEVTSAGQYRYESGLLDMVAGVGLNLNMSLNTPIYFFYNSNFRMVLKSMIGKHWDNGMPNSKNETK